jgi:hypothetical protein
MATNKAPDPGPVVGAYPPRPLSGGAPQPTPPQPHGAYDALEDGGSLLDGGSHDRLGDG